jgi:hypothetical protein
MSTHLIADPATPATAVFPAAPGWLAMSAALTGEVPVIADRDDLLVTIAPGAGHGAPACFLSARATIELDGTHLGCIDPATVTPHRLSDRARYATTWGLLTHECAHAHHSVWTAPPGTDPGVLAAATLLEEPRIEAAQIRRRPDDRHWLRASASNLILATTKAADPAHVPAMTARDAAQSAALLLARTDAGILTRTETAPVTDVVETVLGAERVAKLRQIWTDAFAVADDDTDAMLDLGRRWCDLIGPDPEPAPPSGTGTGSGSPVPSPLAESITTALRAVDAAVATEEIPADPAEAAAAAKAAADAATERATATARTVFAGDGPCTGDTETTGTRPPTAAERTAARTLARGLTTAGIRDRVTTTTTSALPPGRLRMRGALARDAQRAAGGIPTAEPFTRTTRSPVPTPPLRLGIACDVSGSMRRFVGPVASAAWILADATRHTPVPAQTATVIFGIHVRPITHPGATPAHVTQFAARDNWEAVDTAIDALDGALALSRPDAARLLVIVSDGNFRSAPRRVAQQRLDRLRATGCGLLWLATAGDDTPLTGATVHILTDPAATARTIAHAAATALRASH